MSATGTDSDLETVREDGIIEGDKMDKGKETTKSKTLKMIAFATGFSLRRGPV
jgi:hypothetical protein